MQKTLKILVLVFLSTACTQHQKQVLPNINEPKVVESHGYVVPKDSITEPQVIAVDERKLAKIPVVNPTVIPTSINVHVAGLPKSFLPGKPRIRTPGQDGFLLPKAVPVTERSFKAGIPEVVIAKDAFIKDENAQNFSSFSKLQGLSNYVVSMLQDNYGNLWFGTSDGVFKYDGKSFTHFTEKEGLCKNNVYPILQDKSGNLWFGTRFGGVSKYDGKTFTNFTEKEGLCSNEVYSIFQDKSGNLWFGTKGGGVSKYDGKSFTNFTEKEGLSSNYVWSILQDKNGNLWFGTSSGVCKYDGKSFTNFTEKEGLGSNTVFSILEDTSGNLWFGTDYGGVTKYDGKYFTNFTEKEGLIHNSVNSILQDRNGNLWFGTFGGGVSIYDGKSFTNFAEKEGLSSNWINSMLQDRSGNLWFGTAGGGVSKYNRNPFTHFAEKESLGFDQVTSIIRDKSGNLWFTTNGNGVSKYDGKSFIHFTKKDGLNNNWVLGGLQDKIGYFWFATDSGVSKYDGKSFTRFTQKEGLNRHSNSILQDNSGNLWIGTGTSGGGVSKYDGKSFTNFTEKQGLSTNGVNSMLQDKSGNLWFGTNRGVSEYDGKSFTRFTERDGLSNNAVTLGLQDKSGNLWFVSYGEGVWKYDGRYLTHYTEKEGLVSNYVTSWLQDRSGNLWFGTVGGVSKYDGKTFTNFTKKEGLSSNNIVSILQDKSGNLWFGTPNGLNKLTTKNLPRLANIPDKSNYSTEDKGNIYFKSYTYDDGFLGIGCNQFGAILEDSAGTIWIGADDRLTAYHAESDEPDTIPPNIQLTGIALFNENIPWVNLENKKNSSLVLGNGVSIRNFKFNRVSKWYGLPENLSLAYNNNYLTFSFIGITQNLSKNTKYRYKLEGIDKNWSALTSITEAPYGNLPNGSYTFKVKAVNRDGYWSNEYNYSFTIRPPWWETWLFRIILIVFIISAIVFYIKWRERKLRQNNRVLEETVKARTAEVVNQKKQIEYVHEQVSQSIDYAKRIQIAILPEPDLLNQEISEHFVLLKPRDKVSGDFYWWTMVENNLVITVADCTGHGVPGAFMSMLGISFLREIVVKEYMTNPAIILKRLRKEIIHSLKQTGASGEQQDGMDMALVTINTETLELVYAGAINPLYIIPSLNNELIEIIPDKMPVAISQSMGNFTNHEFRLHKGDMIYLLTDGYQDQFGGPYGKKFMSKQLKNLLVTNSRKRMTEQNQILETTIMEWIGDREQTDDITVVGLRI